MAREKGREGERERKEGRETEGKREGWERKERDHLCFFHTFSASRKLEEQGGYSFTITSVPTAFNFKTP